MSEALAPKGRALPAIPIALFIEAGLLLAVGLMFVQRTPDLPVVRDALTLSEVAFAIAGVAWLGMVAVRRPPIRIYSAGLLVPFLVYVGVALLSLLLSPYDSRHVDGLRELLARVYLMAFLLALATYGTDVVRYERLLLAWAIASLILGLLLVLSIFGVDYLLDFEGRFIGLFRNPNALGGAMAGTVLFFLPPALCRAPSDALRTFRRLARWALPGLVAAAYLSDSQGAFLAIVVGLAAWPLIRLSRNWGPALVILLVVTTVPLIVAITQVELVRELIHQVLGAIGYEASGRKFAARIAMIDTQLAGFREYPLLGVGLSKARLAHDPMSFADPHGSHFTIIGIALETGVFGLIAVGVIFVAFLGILRENARLPLEGHPAWRALNEGLVIAFIGFIVFALSHDVQTNRTMWVLAALVVCFRPAFDSSAVLVPAQPHRPSRLRRVLAHGRTLR